ncbi:hypothetical protein F4824DRAFT_290580 [Ustulina deusta]|nr:hypothetical protein F4824DRAFT_290580 [Ustulina deusta]
MCFPPTNTEEVTVSRFDYRVAYPSSGFRVSHAGSLSLSTSPSRLSETKAASEWVENVEYPPASKRNAPGQKIPYRPPEFSRGKIPETIGVMVAARSTLSRRVSPAFLKPPDAAFQFACSLRRVIDSCCCCAEQRQRLCPACMIFQEISLASTKSWKANLPSCRASLPIARELRLCGNIMEIDRIAPAVRVHCVLRSLIVLLSRQLVKPGRRRSMRDSPWAACSAAGLSLSRRTSDLG